MIHIVDSARFKVDKILVKRVVTDFFAKKGVAPTTNINVIFVGKRKMLFIATVYKREPVALPVLSFPYSFDHKMKEVSKNMQIPDLSPSEALLGEVFICYPQVVLLAAERNKKVDDTLTWLIEHGIENLLKSA